MLPNFLYQGISTLISEFSENGSAETGRKLFDYFLIKYEYNRSVCNSLNHISNHVPESIVSLKFQPRGIERKKKKNGKLWKLRSDDALLLEAIIKYLAYRTSKNRYIQKPELNGCDVYSG